MRERDSDGHRLWRSRTVASLTMAAYRFLGNEAVDWRDIMAPHWEQTQRRMQGHPVMLCLQDTTELNFNGQYSRATFLAQMQKPP